MDDTNKELNKLLDTIRTLRGPNGCDWDKKQTHKSLIPYLLEEAHEVVEAINNQSNKELKEELGDLLLHVIFQAILAEEEGAFEFKESIVSIRKKLIRRHPHVFGDMEVEDEQEIKENWEKIKRNEGRDSLMEGLPKSLPSLLLARRIQERASELHFDWDNIEPIWDKIDEEISELKQAISSQNKDEIEEELGDLLFSIVNISRFLKVNPEESLKVTNKKFIQRFQYIEEKASNADKEIGDFTLNQLEEMWQEAKTNC